MCTPTSCSSARILEPVTLAVAEAVHATRLIENRQRQARHLLRVLRPVTAPLAELDDAAAPDVRIALDFPDARAVAVDVVEDQSFAQREIAEREFLGAETSDDRVEQNRAGDAEIGAARIEAGHGETLFQLYAVRRLRSLWSDSCRTRRFLRSSAGSPVSARCQGAQAENRSRRSDDAGRIFAPQAGRESAPISRLICLTSRRSSRAGERIRLHEALRSGE